MSQGDGRGELRAGAVGFDLLLLAYSSLYSSYMFILFVFVTALNRTADRMDSVRRNGEECLGGEVHVLALCFLNAALCRRIRGGGHAGLCSEAALRKER